MEEVPDEQYEESAKDEAPEELPEEASPSVAPQIHRNFACDCGQQGGQEAEQPFAVGHLHDCTAIFICLSCS